MHLFRAKNHPYLKFSALGLQPRVQAAMLEVKQYIFSGRMCVEN